MISVPDSMKAASSRFGWISLSKANELWLLRASDAKGTYEGELGPQREEGDVTFPNVDNTQRQALSPQTDSLLSVSFSTTMSSQIASPVSDSKKVSSSTADTGAAKGSSIKSASRARTEIKHVFRVFEEDIGSVMYNRAMHGYSWNSVCLCITVFCFDNTHNISPETVV